MNVPPTLKASDLNALIKKLSSPRIIGHNPIEVPLVSGSRVSFPGDYAYESPGWHPSPYYDGAEQAVAGRLSGYEVVLDRHCIKPRMALSRRFVEIQSPRLVKETQDWMNSFFGIDYPIHIYGGRMVMHPTALRMLLAQLEAKHPFHNLTKS